MHNKSLCLLFLVGLFPPVSNAFADANTTDFSITVNPSLSLSVSSASVNFEIIPTMQGAYNSASFNVYSSTNNVTGYTLTMSTSNVNLTSNTVNPNTGTNPTISTLTETQAGISVADFQASTDSNVLNHYGVAIDSGNFNAIKTEKTIRETDENNTSVDSTSINLASKLDLQTVPGVYSTTFNFQMTANFVPVTLEHAYAGAGKTKTTIGEQQYYAIQDMTTSICETANVINDVLEVYDNRDNAIYHIGKLADERCWLLDNLAINLVDLNIQSVMNSTNTNATDTSLSYLFGINSRDPSIDPDGNYATAGVTVNWMTKSFVPFTDTSHKNYIYTGSNGGGLDSIGQWKAGGYYNYCAASAGSYCYGSDTTAGTSYDNPDSAIDSVEDICPSSWRMPTGGFIATSGTNKGGGEYQNLMKAITGATGDITSDPAYTNFRNVGRFPLSGNFLYGSWNGTGGGGTFWSSTRNNNNDMLGLTINTGTVYSYPGGGSRSIGFSVRCIAK